MQQNLVFATNNAHKLEEVSLILGGRIKLLSLNDINCHVDIPETASTLEGNALLKAEYIYGNYGLNCFADDTGLEVEALNNEPGVYSARYAGEEKNPQANMLKVLQQLEGKKNRKARFRTVIALLLNGKEYLFEGTVCGQIIKEKRGSSGFGYDPIFMPEGYDKTFAELGNDVKNTISHRAAAVNKLCKFLNDTQELLLLHSKIK
jgi:XTP/dITP diphosphohydrolase